MRLETAPVTPARRPIGVAAADDVNLIRGLAAVAVAAGHCRGMFFTDFDASSHPSLLLKAIYALTGLGHQAVIVFFVLSGFLISASVLKAGAEKWSWRLYLVNRMTRLYIVLIPALALTALLDQAGSQLPHGQTYYYHSLHNFGDSIPMTAETPAIFLGNLVFLQTILVPTFGSNSPLWSLANEFWYYMLFPLVFLILARKTKPKRRVFYAVPVLALAWFLPFDLLLGFGIWMTGVALHFLPDAPLLRGKWMSRAAIASSAGLFAAILALSRMGSSLLSGPVGEYTIGLSCALLLYCILQSDPGKGRLYGRPAGVLSQFSYSLYTIHFPILLVLRTLLGSSGVWSPTGMTMAWGCCILGTAILAGFAFSRVTELKTDQARSLILAKYWTP